MLGTVQIVNNVAELKIEKDGISIRTMDPLRIAMVYTKWTRVLFEEYSSPRKVVLVTLDLNELMKLLNRGGKDELVEIEYNEKTGKVHVRICGRFEKNFTLQSLEAIDERAPILKESFTAKAKLVASGFAEVLEDALTVGEYVRIEAAKKTLTLNAEGDLMTANIEMKKGSEHLLDLEIKEASKSTYNSSFLSEMAKQQARAVGQLTQLEFSNESHCKLSSERGGLTLTYWLAPRVQRPE
jgi:DNA polymerase III sliding clamp (beta) subunit (PCNA family)